MHEIRDSMSRIPVCMLMHKQIVDCENIGKTHHPYPSKIYKGLLKYNKQK